MRIFHLIKGLGRGGAEMLLLQGLHEADRDRFEYGYGYFLPWKDALVPDLVALGADVTCFEAPNPAVIAARVPRVARHLKRWRADVVHCHLPLAGIAGRLAGALAGVPVVYTEHNLQERYHRVTATANKRTWRLQAAAVACSGEVAESIKNHIGGPVPVHTILNGVSLHHFQRDQQAAADLRARLGIPSAAPVMGTVAVFREQKRLELWLEVARRVRAARPDAHFLLVGGGPLSDRIAAEVERLGLSGVVHLPGLQTDVRPFLSAMDVFVMTSKFEGLPVALLEAMATGVPVACTAVGGIPEVVSRPEEGYIVHADQGLDLVPQVLALLSTPELARRVGNAGRERVADRFGIRRMSRELEALYTSVARGH